MCHKFLSGCLQTAAHAAAARQQRQGLERTLYGLAKKGVY